MKNKKLVIILGVILLLVVVGASYAWLTSTILGKKEYVLKAGDLDLVLDETSNGLTIDNAIPVEDVIGLASDGATFSVRNNGKANICYQIYLDDMELSENEIRVNDQFIKYSLDKDSEVGEAKTLISSGTNPNRLIDEAEVKAGSTIQYKLRLWFNVDEDGEYTGQVFKGRLRIEAVQCGNNLPVMRVYTNPSPDIDYHAESYRTKVTSIVTKNDTIIPDNVIESWDVSEAGDNSVIAYATDDGAGGYAITIGGDGGILANENSSYIFFKFTALKRLDLSYFHTSQAINMQSMFEECRNLVTLDLSMFDTSHVENMTLLFHMCTGLTYVNLSSFNTVNLTSAKWMFSACNSLISLDVSSFDVSNLVNMYAMFSGVGVKVLDLTNFDTVSAEDMSYMFYNCSNLETVFVGKGWQIEGANTTGMFDNCNITNVTVVS